MISLASPNIDESDIAAVTAVLRSGMLVQGKEVAAFESEFAAFTGSAHAIAVTNGTATLHLALQALGVKAGDEVIVPAFSYVASANAVEIVGAKPVFVDIRLEDYNIDCAQVEAAVTLKTKALLPVDEFGMPCDLPELKRIAALHGLKILEDAACALGSSRNGQMTGAGADAGSYSLHPRKAITSGEGGVVVTNDGSLADRLRVARNHGISMAGGTMDFVTAGYNCRMTDFQAAMVRGQLRRLPQMLKRRRQIAAYFEAEIRNPLITKPEISGGSQVNWQTYHLLVSERGDRNNFIKQLAAAGIGSNMGAQCIPAQTYYRKKYAADSARDYPCAWAAWNRGLAIPSHEKLTDGEVEQIVRAVNTLR